MNRLRTPNQEEAGGLIAVLAILFGGWIRLFPASISGYPINDGGLFSIMISAIQANHWVLPQYIEYNGQNIPFAYPPFAFYFGAFISTIFKLSAIDVVRWLPGVIAVMTVPAFYILARSVLESSYKAGIATLLFAFTPRSITWVIMGGGLTRSFGLLFLLLALDFIYRLIHENDRKYLPASIIFSSFVVISHPEATLQTIGAAVLFLIFKCRSKAGVLNTLVVATGTLILTSLWWLPTLLQLGVQPYLAAASTGSHSLLSIFFPFFLNLTDEPLLTIVAVLGLIGFVTCVGSRRYMLPIWYFLPYLVDPRSAATYAMIPLAMLAGLAVSEVILPNLARLGSHADKSMLLNVFENRVSIILLMIIGFYMLAGTIYFGNQVAGTAISVANRTALSWIRENASANSRFLVVTGENEPLCDGLEEWFPVLAGHTSITTIQGKEWLANGNYSKAINLQNTIQSCVDEGDPLSCIMEKRLQFDYIYIARNDVLKTFCRATIPIKRGDKLIGEIEKDSRFEEAYQSPEVSIFVLRP